MNLMVHSGRAFLSGLEGAVSGVSNILKMNALGKLMKSAIPARILRISNSRIM